MAEGLSAPGSVLGVGAGTVIMSAVLGVLLTPSHGELNLGVPFL